MQRVTPPLLPFTTARSVIHPSGPSGAGVQAAVPTLTPLGLTTLAPTGAPGLGCALTVPSVGGAQSSLLDHTRSVLLGQGYVRGTGA